MRSKPVYLERFHLVAGVLIPNALSSGEIFIPLFLAASLSSLLITPFPSPGSSFNKSCASSYQRRWRRSQTTSLENGVFPRWWAGDGNAACCLPIYHYQLDSPLAYVHLLLLMLLMGYFQRCKSGWSFLSLCFLHGIHCFFTNWKAFSNVWLCRVYFWG